MLTTSMTKWTTLLLLIIALIQPINSQAAGLKPWNFKLTQTETLCIQPKNSRLTEFHKCADDLSRIIPDKHALHRLTRADEIQPLFGTGVNGAQELLVLTRTRSTPHGSTKYCGAGNEDHIIQLRVESGKMSFRNEILVQSCLKTLSLESDQSDHPLDAFSIDHVRKRIRFRWLGDTEGQYRQVSINNRNHRLEIRSVLDQDMVD